MKYIWNNNEYTQEDIDAALEATGQDLDTYLSENKIEVLEDENEKKLVDVAESADVASETTAPENLDLKSEEVSSESSSEDLGKKEEKPKKKVKLKFDRLLKEEVNVLEDIDLNPSVIDISSADNFVELNKDSDTTYAGSIVKLEKLDKTKQEQATKQILDVPKELENQIDEKGFYQKDVGNYYKVTYKNEDGNLIQSDFPIYISDENFKRNITNKLKSDLDDVLNEERNLLSQGGDVNENDILLLEERKQSLQSQLINLGVDVNDEFAWTNPSDAERLDEFEIVAKQDQSILDANPNDNAIRVAELNSELTNYTTELEKSTDPVEQKRLQKVIEATGEELEEETILLNKAIYTLDKIKAENNVVDPTVKPLSTNLFHNSKITTYEKDYFTYKNDKGEHVDPTKVKDYNLEVTDKGVKNISKISAENLTKNFNSKYLNYGLGADYDRSFLNIGDSAMNVYKNPRYNKSGRIDLVETAKANNIPYDTIIAQEDLQQYLIDKGIATTLETGSSLIKTDKEEIVNLINFIEKNQGDFRKSKEVSQYQKSNGQAGRNQKLKQYNNVIKKSINDVKPLLIKNNNLITKYANDTIELKSIQEQAALYKKETEAKLAKVLKPNEKLKEQILSKEKLEQLVTREANKIQEMIKKDPSRYEELSKGFENWQNNLVSRQKQVIEEYNKNISKKDTILKRFDNKFDSKYVDKLTAIDEKLKQYQQDVTKFSTAIEQSMSQVSIYQTLVKTLEYSDSEFNIKLDRINKSLEGEGDAISQTWNIFTEQFTRTSVGRIAPFELLARGINELGGLVGQYEFGRKIGGYTREQYERNKQQLDFSTIERSNAVPAIANVFAIKGVSDTYAKAYSESWMGGTAQALTQMVGASMGAPVTGLFGGFFLSSLQNSEDKIIEMRNDAVRNRADGVSRAEAKKQFDEKFPKSSQVAYAYIQATVEGALSHVSGKIMKGQTDMSAGLIRKFTNATLSRLGSNATARDIQLMVRKLVGETTAKYMRFVGKGTTAGLDEMLEETTQDFAAMGIDAAFQRITELDFDLPDITSEEYGKQFKHMLLVSFTSGFIGASFSTLANRDFLDPLTEFEKLDFRSRLQANQELYDQIQNIKSDNGYSSELGKIETNLENNVITQEEADQQRKELNDLVSDYKEIPNNLNGSTQYLIAQKKQQIRELNNQLAQGGLSNPANSNIKEAIKNIEGEISEMSSNSNNQHKEVEDKTDFALAAQLRLTAKTKGLDPSTAVVEVFNEDNAQAIADKYGLTVEEVLSPEGVYLKDSNSIIISEKASKGVKEHEGSHNYWDIALNKAENKNAVFGMADAVMKKMIALDPAAADVLQNQLLKYSNDSKYTQEQVAEEVITYYTQMKKAGFFKENKSVTQEIARWFNSLLQSIGIQIEVNAENIDGILDDYLGNLSKGKLNAAQRRLARGDVNISKSLQVEPGQTSITALSEDTTPVVDIKQDTQTQTKQAASLPLSVDTKSMSNAFDKNLTNDLKSNDDFKQSEAAIDAFDAIESNSNFNSYINQLITRDKSLQSLNPEIKEDINRKIKENLQLRILKNFKPELDGNKRSLFSFIYGKATDKGMGGIAFRALQDIKKDYVKTAPTTSIDNVLDDTGRTRDFADTSIDIEGSIDEKVVIPRSKIKQQTELVDEQTEAEFETAALEIIEGVMPDIEDKNFRSFIDDVFDAKLTDKVKKKLGTGKQYEETIKKLAPKMKSLFPIQYFVKLESQTSPENRIFTKPPRRLTKQSEIDQAVLRDDVYLENTAQGVNLYEFNDFTPKQLADYILAPPVSPTTGKRSGLRGNRKTTTAKEITKEIGRDILPSTMDKAGIDPRDRSKVGVKIQRDPRALMAKAFSSEDRIKLEEAAAASDINAAGVIAGLPKGSITVTNSNRASKIKQVLNDIKTFGLSLNVFESSMPAAAGANRVQVNKKKPNGDLTPDAKKLDTYLKNNKIKAKDGVYFYELTNGDYVKSVPVRKKDGSIGQGVTYPDGVTNLVPARGRLYYGKDDPNYIEALETAKENTKKDALIPKKVSVRERITKAFINKFKQRSQDNMQVLEDVAFELDDAVKAGMPASTAALIIAQGYQATGGLIKISAPFTQASTDFNYGPEGSKQGDKNKRPFIEEHNPPASTVGASLIWAIANNKTREIFPFIRKNYFQTQLSKADDFLLDMAKLDKRLPKGFSILDNSIIRLSEAGINLNKIIDPVTGKSLAENFGLGVAPSVNTMPNVVALQRQLIRDVVLGGDLKTAQQTLADYTKFPTNNNPSLAKTQNDANKNTNNTLAESKVLDIEGDLSMNELLSKAASIDAALKNANALDKPIKKIRVFDFDDTLATSNNKVFATRGDERVEMNAEKFATDAAQMIEDGWTMDFSDFDNVTEGGRGPLFEVAKTIKEARGNEDLFVLTARGPNAETAIYDFLKAEGLEFKRENIVGLGKSPGEAKANWIIDKAAEGYNDFYFADDAYQNVKAVQDVLSVIDIKSKVQQAKIQESKQLSEDFNKLLEESTGIEFYKEYSPAKARTIGAGKGRFKFFIPYSAEDLTGLLYTTLTKGPKGDAQMAWYKENLLDPYARAIESLRASRINMMDDFRQLKKSLNVPKDLRKKNDSGFTNEQAVRVYLWNKSGKKVPGLSNTDLKELSDAIENDPKLKLFADQLQALTKEEEYTDPSESWLAGSITGDLIDIINKEKRSKFLAESGYTDNVDAMFSKENLNKLEALYGTKYREAMENILARMKAGRNRLETGNRLSNQVLDYINGSVGAVMFFNTRSAVLQTISAVNFMNWSFNNPIKAGKAFANQPQYWKDFTMLMNSTYLRDRRNGLRLNISESEIADAAATSQNKAKAAIAYILQKGYLPTQYADSFAIASGGATFYRNRVDDLVKQGMDQKAAEEQAMLEWQETAEISQQSSDPSKISAQQSSDLGRIILAWANTPMQYARIQKRAIQDLINGRGDAKTNISKIVYYGVAQNVIFNMLQQATFALGFGDDEDEMTDKELEAYQKDKGKKYFSVLNSMLDSTLRGLGIGGAAVSVGKNFLLDIYERSNRKRPEYVDSVWEFTKLSPPIYSKISKLKNAAWNFDNKKRRKMMTTEGFALTNPAYEAGAKVITAVTNVPLDRVLNKFNNIQGSLDEDNDMWQRIAMLGGWPEWQLKTSKQKLVDQEKIYEQEPNKYNAWEQVSILKQYKLKKYELDKLKNEDDRVKKILELQKSKNKVFKPLDSDKPWEIKMREKMKKEGKTDEEIKEAIKNKKEKNKIRKQLIGF